MALMDFIKKQFVDVIHWTEDDEGILAWRYPMRDCEIQTGAQLTVRDSQLALFVNEGEIADVFGPGLYALSTQTLPVLTNLKNWDKLFASPFKSDVYFFSTRLKLDRRWGTPNPVTIRDKEFGLVRVRAFGIYSYRLTNAARFYQEVSGSREVYRVEDIDAQLRTLVVTAMTDLFGEAGVSFVDMAARQLEFGATLKSRLEPAFMRYGLALDAFLVENVTLPDELQKTLDAKLGINMLGDLNRYTQYQTGSAIPLAAQNEGGVAGVGAGLGAGLAMAQQMGQAIAPAAAVAAGGDDVFATLEKLHALLVKGIVSQAEFDAKKAELLARLR